MRRYFKIQRNRIWRTSFGGLQLILNLEKTDAIRRAVYFEPDNQ